MPGASVPVSFWNSQGGGEGLSGEYQSRVEQWLLRAHYSFGGMRLVSLLTHSIVLLTPIVTVLLMGYG